MTSKKKVLSKFPTAKCYKRSGMYGILRTIGNGDKNTMDIDCKVYKTAKDAWINAEKYVDYIEKNGDVAMKIYNEINTQLNDKK
jgi:hypothetical protein